MGARGGVGTERCFIDRPGVERARRARRRREAAALRRRQEFVDVGLKVAPRLAAASLDFAARKYAPAAAVAHSLSLLTPLRKALFVPSLLLVSMLFTFTVHFIPCFVFMFRVCSVSLVTRRE